MRLLPVLRKALVKAVKRIKNIKLVAKAFDVTRKTVYHWVNEIKRARRTSFKDKPRKPKKPKITFEVEVSIITMRLTFKWGTAKLQQGLMCLPDYILKDMKKKTGIKLIQNIKLSRTAINNLLKKHGLNGYYNKSASWKFFRAKKPNELWQLDLKGPFKIEGVKYWMLVCIDDYSRCLIVTENFDHCPTTKEITEILDKLKVKPKNLLTDNGAQFQKQWKNWCKEKEIKALFAHLHYPQDKGKVERVIRTIAEEFINLLVNFPKWLKNLANYRDWYNFQRYHRGIKDYPINLYV